jgi:hypothetical protein
MSNVALGNVDTALEQLALANQEKSAWILWLGTEPKLDPVRDDPRFQKILRDTKNPIQDQ